MAKYAVANGRKVGIYDSWAECLAQVKGFPNARYKKFSTRQEAEKFLKTSESSISKPSVKTYAPIDQTDGGYKVENINPVPSFSVEKVSPSNSVLNSVNKRLTLLEETINKFMSKTNVTLDTLTKRISELERKRNIEDPPLNDQQDSEECEGLQRSKMLKLENCEFSFKINEVGFVEVYTDGACTNNGKMGARAGIGVWFGHEHPLNVSAPVKGPPTNNNAEIQAARVAILQASRANVRNLTLNTDSKFLINCITQWIHKWKKNDWKLTTGGDVKNKDELIKLESAVKLLNAVEWKYVAGHRGNIGNEMADGLARKGAEEFRVNVTYSGKDGFDYLT